MGIPMQSNIHKKAQRCISRCKIPLLPLLSHWKLQVSDANSLPIKYTIHRCDGKSPAVLYHQMAQRGLFWLALLHLLLFSCLSTFLRDCFSFPSFFPTFLRFSRSFGSHTICSLSTAFLYYLPSSPQISPIERPVSTTATPSLIANDFEFGLCAASSRAVQLTTPLHIAGQFLQAPTTSMFNRVL